MTRQAPIPDHRTTVVVCSALLGGVVMFAIVVAFVLAQGDGKGLAPNPVLDTVAVAVGATMLASGLLLRGKLKARAETLQGDARAVARFQAVLIPIAMLEGGMLFALIAWMMNGNAVPGLVVTCVLLSAAFVLLPFGKPAE